MSTDNNTPWWDPDLKEQNPESAERKPDSGSRPCRLNLRALLWDWLEENIYTALFMLLGFLLALGILCFGLGRTLVVVFCVVGGYFLGSWRDGKASIKQRLRHFYEHWFKDNPLLK